MLGFDALAKLPIAAERIASKASLAATEAADTAAFNVSLNNTVSANFAVTEAADIASFGASAYHTAAIAATETADVASFSGSNFHTASFAMTEVQDVASFASSVFWSTSLSAVEAADLASFSATVPLLPIYVKITSTGNYTIPADFVSLRAIEGIGSGADGDTGSFLVSGRGGGAGAYAGITVLSGLTASGTLFVQVGSPGTPDTWVNKTSNTAPSSTADGILAKGAVADNGGSSTASIGATKFSGGDGGSAPTSAIGGGGGGAAGPSGAGANGAGGTSGGGGGAGNAGQTGGGAGGTSGGAGGDGTFWTINAGGTAGPGGGGAGGNATTGGAAGAFGAGGGGGGKSAGSPAGGVGKAGVVIFSYYQGYVATLVATESPDTASLSAVAVPTATLAATEAPDTASFAASAYHAAAFAASEALDTASFAASAYHTAALAATEAQDTAAFVAVTAAQASFAITEPADVASFAVASGVTLTATLAVTEAQDAASFNVAGPPVENFGYASRRRRRPPQPQKPVQEPIGELVVDEAVLRQIEEERLAALVLQQKRNALRRLEEQRAGFFQAPSTRSVKLQPKAPEEKAPKAATVTVNLAREVQAIEPPAELRPARVLTLHRERFDVVESSPEIRRRVVNLFRPPEAPVVTAPGRSALTLRQRPRPVPQPDIRQTRSVSLRRANDNHAR